MPYMPHKTLRHNENPKQHHRIPSTDVLVAVATMKWNYHCYCCWKQLLLPLLMSNCVVVAVDDGGAVDDDDGGDADHHRHQPLKRLLL